MAGLTAERLREMLNYDPETGLFFWRKAGRGRYVGKRAGCKNAQGYWVVRIDRVLYLAHRLAWLHVRGEWPPYEIDHKDGCPLNNAFGNIRKATSQQNKQNTRLRRDNTSGHKGVTWSKRERRWVGQIHINGRHVCLGYFKTVDDAKEAYREAAAKHFGEFARP